MTISVISEISTTLDDATLEKLSAQLETPSLQVRYGIELAAREILEYLARTVRTPSGGSQVYEFAKRFDGSLLSLIGQSADPFTLLTHDKTPLAKIDDQERQRLANVTSVNSDISREVSEHLVAMAANVVFDALGLKVSQGLTSDDLCQLLFAQTGTSSEGVQTADTCPLTPTMPIPVSDKTEEISTLPVQPVAELKPSSLPQSNIPNLDRQSAPRQPAHVLQAKKTAPVDFSQSTEDQKASPKSRTAMIVAALLAISATGIYTWRVLQARDSAIDRMMVNVENGPESPPSATLAGDRPTPALTKTISLYSSEPRISLGSPSFRRFEDESLGPPVVSWSPMPESKMRYAWDQESTQPIAAGKIQAGPWQVAAQPRNSARRSCFSFD